LKVKMLVAISGTRGGADWPPIGDVLEVSDDEGAQMCAGGLAEPVADTPKAETAVAPEPQKRSGLTTENVPTRSGKGKA
jgi:hypothetical protein